MPEALRHERDFNAFKNQYGIKDVDWGEANRIERHLRAVVLADDATHLKMPAPVPDAVYRAQEAAAALAYSGCRVTILSPGGAKLWFSAQSATVGVQTEGVPALGFTPTGLPTDPQVLAFDARPVASTVETGINAGAAPDGPRLAQFHFISPWQPLYFTQGRVITIWELAGINNAFDCNIRIQEIA